MKKIFVALSLLSLVAIFVSCSEKRCACTYIRGDHRYETHSLEPLDGHANCSELNAEWTATDDSTSAEIITKECVPEGD